MEGMSITVNGQSLVPPGFRFHPTEEELLDYYLRKKIAGEKIDLDIMKDVDLNRLEPWDIQEKCKIGSAPQNDWYFFSHKDRKYPTGTRTNRATTAGFWKATGRDKAIYGGFRRIGMRKTLVFYRGRAPNGQKSDWIMHEYRLDECPENYDTSTPCFSPIDDTELLEEGWVVCRVFKKKSYLRVSENGAKESSSSLVDFKKKEMLRSCSDGTLDQIIRFLSRSCKQDSEFPLAYPVLADGAVVKHTMLPRDCTLTVDRLSFGQDHVHALLGVDQMLREGTEVNDWEGFNGMLDSRVSGQLNCPEEAFGCTAVNDLIYGDSMEFHPADMNIWTCTRPADKDSQSTSRG